MAIARTQLINYAALLSLAACSSDNNDGMQDPALFDGYPDSSVTVPTRQPIENLEPLNPQSDITGFTISPGLPDGLELNPLTGVISGVPTGLSPAQLYTVSATDGEEIEEALLTLAVRTPIVGLVSSRDLVRTELVAGAPVSPSGAGAGLTSTAPTFTTPALVTIDSPQPSTSAVLPVSDLSSTAPGVAPSPVAANLDFVATITIDDSELDDDDDWQFAAQAPYDDDGLAPDLPDFAFDTASVVLEDGTFGLDVELPDESIGPFDSGTLPTSLRRIEALTSGLLSIGAPWVEANGSYFASMRSGTNVELHRYDPDGGVGGAPALGIAADVDAAANDNAEIQAVIAGRLIVRMRNAAGVPKVHAYDPSSDELVEVANLAGPQPDNATDFVDFGGTLYFVASDAAGSSAVYRYGFGGPSLERVSDTTGNGSSEEASDLHVVSDMLYFLAHDGAGETHLYRFDPVFMTQERLSSDAIAPVTGLTAVGDRVFVTGRNSQAAQKLFLFDPVSGSLRQIANTAGDETTDDNVEFLAGFPAGPGDLYFKADNTFGVQKLHRYSEASGSATVQQVTNTSSASITDFLGDEFVQMGDLLFLEALNSTNARKLFALDLTTGVATQACNINATDTNDGVSGLLAVGTSRLAFSATLFPGGSTEIFEYDLESGETRQLADINPGASDDASPLAVIDGELVFRATNAAGDVAAYVVE